MLTEGAVGRWGGKEEEEEEEEDMLRGRCVVGEVGQGVEEEGGEREEVLEGGWVGEVVVAFREVGPLGVSLVAS